MQNLSREAASRQIIQQLGAVQPLSQLLSAQQLQVRFCGVSYWQWLWRVPSEGCSEPDVDMRAVNTGAGVRSWRSTQYTEPSTGEHAITDEHQHQQPCPPHDQRPDIVHH